jgi:hypothetical protein
VLARRAHRFLPSKHVVGTLVAAVAATSFAHPTIPSILMSYIHPAALEARRKYWTRPDAYRFAAPGTPEAKMPGWLDPSATRVRLKEAQEEEARAQAAAEQEQFEHELWLFEQKYSPNQPRDELGRWTSGANSVGDAAAAGTEDGSGSSEVLSDASLDPIRASDRSASVIRICMLGTNSISTDRFGNQSWWADYVCADGFTFRLFGTRSPVPGFSRDRR